MAYNDPNNTGIPVPNPGGNRRPGNPYSRPGGLPNQGPSANMQGFNRPGPPGPNANMNPGPNAHMNSGGGPRPYGGPNQMTPGPNAHMNSGGPRGLPNQMGPRRLPQPGPNAPMRPQQAGNSPGQWAGDIRRVPQGGGGYGQNQQNPMNTGRGGARRVGSNNALAGRMGNRRRY